MPTYDYECKACGHSLEQFQSITAGPIRKCPACGKHSLKRLIGTGAGVIFKGSGFYQTDYRSESYKAGAKAEAEKGSGGTKAEDSKAAKPAESKAAAKPSSKRAEAE